MALPSSPEAWGARALGIFIGYLTWYFVVRFSEYTVAELSAVASVVAGGVVIAFLEAGTTAGQAAASHRWYDPVGLVLGFLLFCVFFYAKHRYFPATLGARRAAASAERATDTLTPPSSTASASDAAA